MTWTYRVGLSQTETKEEALNKSGLVWEKVNPREKIISLAPTFLGVPYKFGSSVLKDSPNSFDCSSFTAYLYVRAGIAIPRICNDQYHAGQEISEADASPGDIVFFNSSRTDIPEGVIGHNGLYMGDGEMIHAGGVSMGYGQVVREKIVESRYYPTGLAGFRRLIQSEEERYVVEIPESKSELCNREKLIEYLKSVYTA